MTDPIEFGGYLIEFGPNAAEFLAKEVASRMVAPCMHSDLVGAKGFRNTTSFIGLSASRIPRLWLN